MERNKLLTIAVFMLLILNIGTLIFLWAGRHGHHPPPFGQGRQDEGPPAFRFLVHELKLDSMQEKKYAAMRDAHHATADSLIHVMKDEREKLFDLIASTDTAAIDSQIHAIAGNQANLESATFHHFRDLFSILNETQQHRFNDVIDDALRMITGPHPPPDQHPPPPHP